MELLIKRDQDKGMLGGIKFVLEARAILTEEENELVKKYKAHKFVLFNSATQKNFFMDSVNIEYTINDLISGVKDKVNDVTILLQKERIYIEACKNLKTALDVMKSFGGDYRLIFKEDGVYDTNGEKLEY